MAQAGLGVCGIQGDDMAYIPTADTLRKGGEALQKDWLVIGASSLGTVFEWYDFFLYGLLASIISAQFFSGVNDTTGFIFALAAFAAGFAVRPFGALVFGRLGDLADRAGRLARHPDQRQRRSAVAE